MASADSVKCLCSQIVYAADLRNHFMIYHLGCTQDNLPGEFYCKTGNCKFHADNLTETLAHCIEKGHNPKQIHHWKDVFRPHIMDLTARVMELNKDGGSLSKAPRRKPEKASSPAKRRQSPSEGFLLSETAVDTPAVIQIDSDDDDDIAAAASSARSSSRGKRKRSIEKKVGRKSQRQSGPPPVSVNPESEAGGSKKTKGTPKSREAERPFKCQRCSFAPKLRNVRELSALRSHARLHLEPFFQCVVDNCDFVSNNPSTVRTHIGINHHMEKDPVCKVDADSFAECLDKITKECFGDLQA